MKAHIHTHHILAAVNQDEGTHTHTQHTIAAVNQDEGTHTHTTPVLLGVYVLAYMSVYLYTQKENKHST